MSILERSCVWVGSAVVNNLCAGAKQSLEFKGCRKMISFLTGDFGESMTYCACVDRLEPIGCRKAGDLKS